MINYDEALARAADQTIALVEAKHWLAVAIEIREGIEWQRQLTPAEMPAFKRHLSDIVPHYAGEPLPPPTAADAQDLAPFLAPTQREVGSETMIMTEPVRQHMVDAITEKLTIPGGERICMHCSMVIRQDSSDTEQHEPAAGATGWRHVLSGQRRCYGNRMTVAWPAAIQSD